MTALQRSVAFLAVLAASSAAASAATIVRSSAMAERTAIDAICDVYDAQPSLVRHIQLARVAATPGVGPWRLTGANPANASTAALEFADVFSRDGKIVYAIDTRSDPGGAREYCFANGRLVRASSGVVDTTTDESKSRKLYFDAKGALFADTGLVTRDIDKRRNDLVPVNASQTFEIAVYRTPSALPFYGAYRSALAGRLTPLR